MSRKENIINKLNQEVALENLVSASFYYKDLVYRNLLTEKEINHFSYLFNGATYTNTPYDKEFFEYFGQFYKNFTAYQEESNIKNAPIEFKNEKEFLSFVSPRMEFQNNKKSLGIINSPFTTKSDIIKSASEQDSRSLSNAEDIINQVWSNPHYNALFTLLSIFIAEGKEFKFLFSDHLGMQMFPSYLESNYKLDIFVHESYHALQGFIFNHGDYYPHQSSLNNFTATKKEFLDAFCKTCVNIIKVMFNYVDLNTIDSHDHKSLAELIIKSLPEMAIYCHSGITPEVINQIAIDDINSEKTVQDINNGKNFTTHDEVLSFINGYCSILEEHFSMPSSIIERISYLLTTDHGHGEFTEIMPVAFELMALETDQKFLDMFSPMLNYFDKQIVPIIEEYKALHIEYNCAPLLDQINNQCLQLDYTTMGLTCISDFIE